MARKTDKPDTVKAETYTIACNVDAATYAALEDYRWSNRLSRSAALAQIISQWCKDNAPESAEAATVDTGTV